MKRIRGVLYFDDMPGDLWKIKTMIKIMSMSMASGWLVAGGSRVLEPAMILRALLTFGLVAATGLAVGCGKHDDAPAVAVAATNAPAPGDQTAPGTVPGAMPTPATQQVIAAPENGDLNATLAELTRELRRTMIGRRLSGSFEEFVAIRNLKVPPPPPGKKYAISKQWRVVLVDQ